MPQGTIFIGEAYNIKQPKDSVIAAIQRLGYNCHFHAGDTSYYYNAPYYQTDNIIRHHKYSISADTIASIKYALEEINPNKTRLTIINVTLSKEGNIQDWKMLKALSNNYSAWLKKNWIEKVKE